LTRYFALNLKSLITNPQILFWSVLFMEFWVFMWAFVFGREVPAEGIREYVSTAYGSLLVLSLAATGVGIAFNNLYASKAIRFVTKFTRLSPSRFFIENLLSSLAVLLIIAGVLFGSILGVFAWKKGVWILPENVPGFVLFSVLGAVLVYLIAVFFVYLVVVLRMPRAAFFISFLPLILGFVAYGSLWIDYGALNYFLPFNSISFLFFSSISGRRPYAPMIPGFAAAPAYFDTNSLLLSLSIYIAALSLLDIYLFRKARGVAVEEIRLA